MARFLSKAEDCQEDEKSRLETRIGDILYVEKQSQVFAEGANEAGLRGDGARAEVLPSSAQPTSSRPSTPHSRVVVPLQAKHADPLRPIRATLLLQQK